MNKNTFSNRFQFELKSSIFDSQRNLDSFNNVEFKVFPKEVIPIVDGSPDKWYGLNQDDFRPDRANHFLKLYQNEFTEPKVDSYDSLMKLVSRSKALREWYSIKDVEYVLQVQVPQYYKDRIDPKLYDEIGNDVQKINRAQRSKAEALNKAAEEYKMTIKKIEEDSDKNFIDLKLLESNPFIYIMNLTQESLPLSAASAIEKYTPASAKSPTRDAYAREMLIQYKCKLLDVTNKQKLSVFGVKKMIETFALK